MVEREEGFLGRWSRRKRDAVRGAAEADLEEVALREERPDTAADAESARAVPPAVAARLDGPVSGTAPGAGEPFDVSTLPPVESLGAGSDYAAFMRPGVPDNLRRLALRKAWVANPAVADFRGFADYDWDYNAPGYGRLLPTDDLARLCRSILGDDREDEEREPAGGAPTPPSPRQPAPEAEPVLVAGAGAGADSEAGPGAVEVEDPRVRREAVLAGAGDVGAAADRGAPPAQGRGRDDVA